MELQKLSGLIDKTKPHQDKPRTYIGASSIGSDCLRQIWYAYNGYPSEPLSARQQRNLDIGSKFESMVLDWLELSGVEIRRPCKANNYLEYRDKELAYFKGHADALLPELNAVLDIKVVKSSSWREFVKKGLFSWSPLYYAQLQSYMGMSGFPNAYLLALNKDTAELHDERITFDSAYYENLKERAMLIAISKSEPARISIRPNWWLCKGCKYRRECHK